MFLTKRVIFRVKWVTFCIKRWGSVSESWDELFVFMLEELQLYKPWIPSFVGLFFQALCATMLVCDSSKLNLGWKVESSLWYNKQKSLFHLSLPHFFCFDFVILWIAEIQTTDDSMLEAKFFSESQGKIFPFFKKFRPTETPDYFEGLLIVYCSSSLSPIARAAYTG